MGIKTSRPIWKPPNECSTIIPCEGIGLCSAGFVLVCCWLLLHVCFEIPWSPPLWESIEISHSILCFLLGVEGRGLGSQSTALVMSVHILLRRSLKMLYKTLLLTQNFPCPYHLQSSGKVERMSEIFTSNLAQLSETLEFPWSKVLPLTLLTIRSTPLRVHCCLLISW